MRDRVVEEALSEAKDQASTMKEEAKAAKAWASKVVVEVVKAFKIGGEYSQMVLESSKSTFI